MDPYLTPYQPSEGTPFGQKHDAFLKLLPERWRALVEIVVGAAIALAPFVSAFAAWYAAAK